MLSRKLIVPLATATVFALFSLLAVGSQRPSRPLTEHPRYKKWPITDFDKPDPSDPQARKARKLRGNRFGLKDKSVDARRFAITEERESNFGSPPSHAPSEPALPVASSDAIVIAEVKAAAAFLSSDRTAIYSEFKLSVTEIIHAKMSLGSELTAIRGGGGVRFPSGKIIFQGYDPTPLPTVGVRYLFFLQQFDSDSFLILTAYEIRMGRVFPLDGRGPNGWMFPEYAEHQKLTGIDETAFLYFVRRELQSVAREQAK